MRLDIVSTLKDAVGNYQKEGYGNPTVSEGLAGRQISHGVTSFPILYNLSGHVARTVEVRHYAGQPNPFGVSGTIQKDGQIGPEVRVASLDEVLQILADRLKDIPAQRRAAGKSVYVS